MGVVVILLSGEKYRIITGGSALLCIIIPVLPVPSTKQTSGIFTWILLTVFTLTMAIDTASLVLVLIVFAAGMKTKAS